jgi:hypothetical protein
MDELTSLFESTLVKKSESAADKIVKISEDECAKLLGGRIEVTEEQKLRNEEKEEIMKQYQDLSRRLNRTKNSKHRKGDFNQKMKEERKVLKREIEALKLKLQDLAHEEHGEQLRIRGKEEKTEKSVEQRKEEFRQRMRSKRK